MAKKDKNKNVGITILEIRETSFSNKITDKILKNFSEKKVLFKTAFKLSGNKKEDTVTLGILVDYAYRFGPKKGIKEFLTLETETTFKIYDATKDELVISPKGDEIFIEDELMVLFLNTAFGATRGMLAYKMASLPINLVLPIIDLKEFFEEEEIDNSKIEETA